MRLTVHNHRRPAPAPFFSHQAAAFLIFTMGFICRTVDAYDITDKFSVGGVLAGAYQIMDVEAEDLEERGGGTLCLQPEFSFRPTNRDELFTKLGFAAGNGLIEFSPFVLHPWAADLEDHVKNIHGSGRDYLLTAWYKHTFDLGAGGTLGLTAGLIDATDYLDVNAFANDEYTQFMNEALVNGPNGFFPSYDLGSALEWDIGNVEFRAVAMHINSNQDGNAYQFYGVQFDYKMETPLGKGTYRLVLDSASHDFLDPAGERTESRSAAFVSLDQELGDTVGVFLRIGTQDDDAAINFKNLLSGGVTIGGLLWGRERDNVGIGYAFLDGGNLDIDYSWVAEAYARLVLNDYLALTPDIQYIREKRVGGGAEGFVFGIRMVLAEF